MPPGADNLWLRRLLPAVPVVRPAVERGSLVVMAAEGKPDAKKKMASPVKRALISEERRMYNKGKKSACATRIKKVRTSYGLGSAGANWA